MNKAEFCIIAVGYNRAKAMQRLLNSLCLAEYEDQKVDLLISIDKGPNQGDVIKVAEECIWKFGGKKIRAFTERQGLKNHIIQCGDVSSEYEAIIVLEDDITVSKAFFAYTKQCVNKYRNDNRVAGISLYKHHINVGVNSFFEPEFNGYDCYWMQFAQSWGQCWTKKMWAEFKLWYKKNGQDCFDAENSVLVNKIPNNILNWGDKSWMKYYMAYIVDKNLYFIYPHFALSTNHSEAGQHSAVTSSDYHVCLNNSIFQYRLPEYSEAVRYDIFFEREDLRVSGYEDKNICIDLYGNKKDYGLCDYLISTAPKPYEVVESFKLKYRPHELNCLYREDGNDVYIYDLKKKVDQIPKYNPNIRVRFDVRCITWRKLLSLGMQEIKAAVEQKFNRIMR